MPASCALPREPFRISVHPRSSAVPPSGAVGPQIRTDRRRSAGSPACHQSSVQIGAHQWRSPLPARVAAARGRDRCAHAQRYATGRSRSLLQDDPVGGGSPFSRRAPRALLRYAVRHVPVGTRLGSKPSRASLRRRERSAFIGGSTPLPPVGSCRRFRPPSSFPSLSSVVRAPSSAFRRLSFPVSALRSPVSHHPRNGRMRKNSRKNTAAIT